MPNDCPDPGFEEIPSLWTLGTDCDVGTAVIQGSIVHSGARALQIISAQIGGTTRCGWASISAPTIPGGRYRLSAWIRGSGVLTRPCNIKVDGTVRINASGLVLGVWKYFISSWFVVAGSSVEVKVEMPFGVGPVAVRSIDDLVLEREIFLDDADPSSLAARAGVSILSSVQGAAGDQNRVSASVSALSVQSSLSSLAARASVIKR